MLKYSAHLDLFFQELPVKERLNRFAGLGFKAFEFWCWWDSNKYNPDDIARLAENLRMQTAAVCTRFISLTDPSFRPEYLSGLRETVQVCRMLNCRTIISQVGKEIIGLSRVAQKTSLVDGLKEAGSILNGTGITLVIEPLNVLVNHPGYFLTRSDEAAEIINSVGSDSVKMLFDVYHQQITEGNIIANIRKYINLIGHFHIADNPGRHQPGTGEINYPNVLSAIADLGYQGYVGLEFIPHGTGDEETLRPFVPNHGRSL